MVFSENSWQLPSKRPEKMPFFEWDWMYNRLISIGSRDTSARFWIPAVGPSMFRLVLLKWRSEAGLMWKLGIQKMRATAVIHKKSGDFEKEKWMAYDFHWFWLILIDFGFPDFESRWRWNGLAPCQLGAKQSSIQRGDLSVSQSWASCALMQHPQEFPIVLCPNIGTPKCKETAYQPIIIFRIEIGTKHGVICIFFSEVCPEVMVIRRY